MLQTCNNKDMMNNPIKQSKLAKVHHLASQPCFSGVVSSLGHYILQLVLLSISPNLVQQNKGQMLKLKILVTNAILTRPKSSFEILNPFFLTSIHLHNHLNTLFQKSNRLKRCGIDFVGWEIKIPPFCNTQNLCSIIISYIMSKST